MPTILELFRSKQLNFPAGSTADGAVKKDTETLIEQETSGIRVKSAVDINNPLIYGNEAMRITKRSTPTLEKMKDSSGGDPGDGGLIGGKLTQARDFINSEIGIPETLIPTKVSEKIIEIRGDGSTSADPITVETFGKNGSDVGKFLKQSGGGNPKTILKQAVGGGITKLKDKARTALFGDAGTIGEAAGDNNNFTIEYSNKQKYQDVVKELMQDEDGTKENSIIDLSKVSPVYYVKRKDGLFGTPPEENNGYSYGFKSKKGNTPIIYNYEFPYTGKPGSPSSALKDSLKNLAGVDKTDEINLLTPSDNYTVNDDGSISIDGRENDIQDLIPLYINKLGAKPVVFRSTVTGISETVSPSWSGNKFVGNPYQYYTYDGVERNVTFNLNIYCMSPGELVSNWERITALTKMAYPTISSGRKMNPPIIQFRLGDLYVNKVGFVESLTHTIPDNSNWETNSDMGYLPKLIDCSITIKFIEDENSVAAIYGYKKSDAAIEAYNEERESNAVDLNSRTNADGTPSESKPKKVGKRGEVKDSIVSFKEKVKSKTKDIKTGAKQQTPEDVTSGVEGDNVNQSATTDNLDGETTTVFTKKVEAKYTLTGPQSQVYTSMKKVVGPKGKVRIIGVKDIPGDRGYVEQNFDIGTIFLKAERGEKVGVYSVGPMGSPMLVYDSRREN